MSIDDRRWMARALELAWRGLYSTDPNPRVGCVIVKDGRAVGEGWHVRAGEPHAEINALRQAGGDARDAVAYVTLEPCSHHGRTPPCAEALIQAGVTRVVAAIEDPNPQVAGRGLQCLRAAGIEVSCGELEMQARELNPGFIKRMETGFPYVRLKMAMSLDGRTAMANGESQWITGPAARSAVQRLRARSSAVLTGADTVINDDARLTVRPEELGLAADVPVPGQCRQPLRVLIDGRGRVSRNAAFFRCGPALVIANDDTTAAAYRAEGHELWALPGDDGHVDLRAVLTALAARGVNELLIEAGPRLAGAFARQGWVDEYQIFMAPKLLGSTAMPLLDWDIQRMSETFDLQIRDIRAVGEDWRIMAVPRLPAERVKPS